MRDDRYGLTFSWVSQLPSPLMMAWPFAILFGMTCCAGPAYADETIKRHEGYRTQAYPDANGRWAICYGSTSGVRKGMTATEEDCKLRFNSDMAWTEEVIEAANLRLTVSQLRALRSFILNVGSGAFNSSTLLRKVRAGDCRGAAQEFHRWVYAEGKVLPGLVQRRAWESAQFMKGCR